MLENIPLHTAIALLLSRLHASQQQMIHLNDAVPRASKVAARHLDYWFTRTFPALTDKVTVKEIRVCRLQGGANSEHTADGPALTRTAVETVPLDTLFWRAVAGQMSAREFFLELGNIDIVVEKDSVTDRPAVLNSLDAKEQIKRLIGITPGSYERLLVRALDDFWDRPPDRSQDTPVSDWLAYEFGAQLKAQADLHRLDRTLSLPMHKAITEGALAALDAATRAWLEERVRPGVYSLSITPEGWGFDVLVSGVVVLTQHDSLDDPGGALLYRPGRPLEVYSDLAALKTSLKADNDASDEVDIVPIAEDFLARLVTDLRTAQKTAVSDALLRGPAAGETITAWVARLDAAASVKHRLDLAAAMDERELRLNLQRLGAWLHGNPNVIGSDRVAWWRAVQDLQSATADTPPPDPVTLATPEALHDRTRTLLAGFISEKYPPVDPDDVSLNIRRQLIDSHAPTGGSPFGSGISQGSVRGVIDDRRSMTQWAMSNLTDDERNAPQPTVEGPLSFAQIVEVIERANIGARLATELQLAARERQAEWMSLKAKQMRAQAWAAHISGDLRHDRDNTGLKLVLEALDNPTAAGRGKVNGHEVVVRQLCWGDSVLKEVLAFGVKTVASRPSLTLYTPGAPDGKNFRDVDAQNARALETTLAQTLTATSEMTRWLISHLPLQEQAEQFDSLVPNSENLTFEQKIKQVTQSVIGWAKDRAQNDFAMKISSPVVEANLFSVLHETQIAHAIKTADMLTVTNAERDSASVREGRRNGVMLLTGAMSMFPVGQLGGILGRAILPTMLGGAALSAIDDASGSLRQWTSDFIGGLGEIIAEAGQDLIMARVGRRGQARPMLSSLPRMPDPELEPFVLRGFDGKGLVPEGRNRYRDAGGQGYLVMHQGFYKTAVQGGERIIYAPDNRSNQRTVTWEKGEWRVEERQRLRGGGAVQSLLGWPSETPQQRTYNALVEGVLVKNRNASPEAINTAKGIFNSMPEVLAERILSESMADTGAADISTYRSQIRDLSRGWGNMARHKAAHGKLLDKMNTWGIVVLSCMDIEAQVSNIALTDVQKIKIYDTILAHQNMFFTQDTIRMNTTIITDNLTGAVFMAITPKTGKKRAAIDKIAKDTREMLVAVERKMEARATALFPGNEPQAIAAKRNYMASTDYYNELIDALREEKQRRHKPGLLTEIRNHRVPYIIANRGKTRRNVMLITEEEITNFTSTLSNYEPFDIDLVTQARTHRVTATQPSVATPVLPEPSPAPDKFTVGTSLLAETQMAYDNFTETARTKVMEIMDDIRAGRVTTKRINRYYWYDMARLDPGHGRGAWRAAFERQGDTWTLQGFYDYHANKPATVWGG